MTRKSADSAVKTRALQDFGREIDPRELFPTLEPGATDFALQNPYAFAMAVCLDRGTTADIIWTIPFYIRRKLGLEDSTSPKRVM